MELLMTESEFIQAVQTEIECMALEGDRETLCLQPFVWLLSDWNRAFEAFPMIQGMTFERFLDRTVPMLVDNSNALAAAFVAHRDICSLEAPLRSGIRVSELEVVESIKNHFHYEVIELVVLTHDSVKVWHWRVLRETEDSLEFTIESPEQVPVSTAPRFENIRTALTANIAILN